MVVKGAVPSKAMCLKYLLEPWEAWVVREAGVKDLHRGPQPPAALDYREVSIWWRN